MRRKLLDHDDPAVGRSLNILATLLLTENRLEEAEGMFREAIDIRRKQPESEHLDLASSLINLAALLEKKDQPAEAEALQREGLSLRRKLLGLNHRETLDSLINVLIILEKQGKHADAEPLLLEANEAFQRDPAQSADAKRAAIKRVRDFYIDWAVAAPGTGKMEKSAEWRKKLVEFDEAALAPKTVQKEN